MGLVSRGRSPLRLASLPPSTPRTHAKCPTVHTALASDHTRYDGLGRRIQKVDVAANPDVTYDYYLSEAWQVVEVRKNGSANPLEQFAWHAYYIDAPLVRFYDSNTDGAGIVEHYYGHDAQFNATVVFDDAANVAERYTYTPYGELTVMNASWTTLGSSAIANAYTYTGREYHSETGFYNFRNRYYHAQLGRFVNRDPIDYWDGFNLYQAYFVPDGVDPLGLAEYIEVPGGGVILQYRNGTVGVYRDSETGHTPNRVELAIINARLTGDKGYIERSPVAREALAGPFGRKIIWGVDNPEAARRLSLAIVSGKASPDAGPGLLPGRRIGAPQAGAGTRAGSAPSESNLLPIRRGGKTSGILCTEKYTRPIQSGKPGPAATLPKPTPGFNAITSTHVEGHAAAIMRQEGIREATLYINNPVICKPCLQNLTHMLPEGSKLTVVLPDGTSTTFVGNAR